MKKKIYLLSLFCLMLLTSVYIDVVADVFKTIVAYASFPKVTITHTAISTISPDRRILNPKISVDFGKNKNAGGGVYVSATARILYYINDNVASILSAPDSELTIYNNTDFYITLPTLAENTECVDYRIRITATNNSGGSEELYYPSDGGYIHAVVTSSSTATVSSSDGGTVGYGDGDQEHSDTTVTFDPGSVDGSGQVGIEDVSLDDFFNSFFPVSSLVRSYVVKSVTTAELDRSKMVKLFKVYSIGSVTINTQGYAEFSYGDSQATKFDILFSSDGTNWENVKVTKIDTERKVVCCDIKEFGYYLIMVSSNLSDGDYRPAKRVRVKSRIANGTYEGFRFGNLGEGDIVKIYNLNGKKVAELTAGGAGGFVWKGKKDTNNSGDWAESGTYIYQIKLKEKGKIISGTIAFVW